MADPRHVRFARELEERDARIAAELAELRDLQADTEELRAHAESVTAIRAAYPFERERLRESLAAAADELAGRASDRAVADAELERARDDEETAAARRALTRTADAESLARRKRERVEEELATLERDAARAEEDTPRLERRAGELAERLDIRSRVTRIETSPSDLAGVLEWTSRARAALLVAAAGLETERERVVREANELGAAALGEPALAASVALIRARIERAANP